MDRYLQQFMVVAELQSISKAAEYLHLTQPTISANLQRLENNYGVKLYRRQSRGVRLTPFGEAVLKHCREMQQSQQRLHVEIQDLQQRELGKVRLGCGDAWWELFVRDALAGYLREHNAALTLNLGNHLDLMAQLLAGQIDCFIGHQISGLAERHPAEFTPLFRSADVNYVAAGHPLLVADADNSDAAQEAYPLLAVTPDKESMMDLLDDPLPKQRISQHRHHSPRPLYEVGTLAASIDLLKISDAIMPYPAAMRDYFAQHGIYPLPRRLPTQENKQEAQDIVGLYQHREQLGESSEQLIIRLAAAARKFSMDTPEVEGW